MTQGFIGVFLFLMVAGIPIALALAAGGISYFVFVDKLFFLQNLSQKLIGGVNQFPLLAIPLFVLAGEIMNRGGITTRLINLANASFGHWRGGLAQVNIASNIMFAGLSGSAVAGASVLGSILIPAMEKAGYTRSFSAAVTSAACIIGPIIPPSVICVLYAFTMQISVIGLFIGCVIPGALLGGLLMLATRIIATRANFPEPTPKKEFKVWFQTFKEAFLPLLTPFIILGGTLGGVFTATEAAAAAVAYALFLSLFVLKTLKLRELPMVFQRATLASATILIIVAGAFVFAWAVTLSGLPAHLANLAVSFTENKYLLLLIINIALLIVGMFLDAGPAVLIVAPILAPTAMQYGVDPTHFAIMVCVNLCVGLTTPPMGLVLFVSSAVAKINVTSMLKDMIPYWIVHIVVIGLVTYIPELTLWLPSVFGF